MSGFNICVGVDGSSSSAAALSLAIDEARVHDGTVHAITAWHVDLIGAERYGGYLTDEEWAEAEATARKTQEAAIEAVVADLEAVPTIERHVVQGLPGPVLVAGAEDCDFLVVGTEHKGVLKRALIGSTSHHCIRNSRTPVVVVPQTTQA